MTKNIKVEFEKSVSKMGNKKIINIPRMLHKKINVGDIVKVKLVKKIRLESVR